MGFFDEAWCIPAAVALVILILLVLVFSRQLNYWVKSTMRTLSSMLDAGDSRADRLLDDDDLEHLDQPDASTQLPPGQTSDTLLALGYTSEVPWDEVIQATELDPSTFVNHMDFVKDVRRFSSGANFTAVTDDNTNSAFVNFVGLRRPEHVPIGSSARTVPDVDEDVLKRTKNIRWGTAYSDE